MRAKGNLTLVRWKVANNLKWHAGAGSCTESVSFPSDDGAKLLALNRWQRWLNIGQGSRDKEGHSGYWQPLHDVPEYSDLRHSIHPDTCMPKTKECFQPPQKLLNSRLQGQQHQKLPQHSKLWKRLVRGCFRLSNSTSS